MSSLLSDFGRLVRMGLALSFPVLVQGQSSLLPQGGESLLSGALAGDQAWPGLSLNSQGGYVVWQDNNIDHAGWGIAMRHLDVSGAPVGPMFQVNASAAYDQERPQVATLNDGGAVFVWEGGRTGFHTVYARFMRPAGTFLTGDVLVSQPLVANTNRFITTLPVIRNNRASVNRFIVSRVISQRRDFHASPMVAVLANGNVVMAYSAYQRLTTNAPAVLPMVKGGGRTFVTNSILVPVERGLDLMQDVYVRRYTPGGLPVGAEFRANQFTKYNQRNAALASLDSGGFVVAWVSENQGVTENDMALGVSRQDIYARLFDAAGKALTDEFRVNDAVPGQNGSPAVAGLAGGGFRVAWAQSSGSRAAGLDVVTRSFAAGGQNPSATLRVNTYTAGDQYAPRIASCPAGELVVWTSLGQDGADEGVFGQWISGGSLSGNELAINTTTGGRQYQQTVCAGPGNLLVVGWSGLNRRTAFDIFGRIYSASNP
jgi:large repetitive protein